MSRIKSWIPLFLAAAALLGVYVSRDTANQAPVVRAQLRAPETPNSAIDPAGIFRTETPSDTKARTEAEIPVRSAALPVAEKSDPAVAPLPAREGEVEEAPGSRVDPATLVRLHGKQPLTSAHPHVKPVIDVQTRNAAWLMALPAVVGTAVGLNDEGEVALVVLTKVEAPELPRTIDGVPVVVWKSGEISSRVGVAKEVARPEAKASGKPQPAAPPRQTKVIRPVAIGVSTGLPADATPMYWTAGTLGCRVKNQDGQQFALSNFHVYSWKEVAPIGSPVLQPGTLDSRGSITDGSDFLGVLHAVARPTFTSEVSTAVNKVDAAIALCNPGTLGKETLTDGYGTPASSTTLPALGLFVEKYGRTTGYTLGTITTINVTITVQYDTNATAKFVEQIGISKRSRSSPAFSDSGDSGSLIVVSTTNVPVGLLFAGGGSSTFANPIDAVLSALQVTIDGQ